MGVTNPIGNSPAPVYVAQANEINANSPLADRERAFKGAVNRMLERLCGDNGLQEGALRIRIQDGALTVELNDEEITADNDSSNLRIRIQTYITRYAIRDIAYIASYSAE